MAGRREFPEGGESRNGINPGFGGGLLADDGMIIKTCLFADFYFVSFPFVSHFIPGARARHLPSVLLPPLPSDRLPPRTLYPYTTKLSCPRASRRRHKTTSSSPANLHPAPPPHPSLPLLRPPSLAPLTLPCAPSSPPPPLQRDRGGNDGSQARSGNGRVAPAAS